MKILISLFFILLIIIIIIIILLNTDEVDYKFKECYHKGFFYCNICKKNCIYKKFYK